MAELGLDIGTWSVAALLSDARGRRLVPDADTGRPWFRAAVGLGGDGAWLTGGAAEELRTTHPDRCADDLTRRLRDAAPLRLADADHPVPALLAVLARRVLAEAGRLTAEPIETVYLSVPVAFDDRRRRALREAVTLAGFDGPVELVEEPVAAARTALGATDEAGTWLVVDIGGGTLDLALVDLVDDQLSTLDTAGRDDVGGFALDVAVRGWLRAQVGIAVDDDALLATARSLKHQLGEGPVGFAANPLGVGPARFVLTAAEFAVLAAPVAAAVDAAAEAFLLGNDTRWTELAGIVATGGATRGGALLDRLARRARLVRCPVPAELTTVHGLVPTPDDPLRDRLPPAPDHPRHEAITAPTAPELAPVETLDEHTDTVAAVAFSPDGRRLATASWDRTVRLHPGVLRGHEADVTALAFDPTGELLASGGEDRTVRIWTPGGHTGPIVLTGHTDTVRAVAFSRHRLLASGSADGTVRLWNGRDGEPVETVQVDDEVHDLAFSPDGRSLLIAAAGATVLWDLPGGRVVRRHPGATAVACSPDGRLLAIGGTDGSVDLRAAGTHAMVETAAGADDVAALTFSPASDLLAVAGPGVTLLQVPDLTVVGELDHEGAWVHDVAFSPDGTRLVTGTDEDIALVWAVG